MMGTVAPSSEPGLRMTGKYSSSSGLLLDFGGDAVTLDCGQAHVKAPYTVENTAAQFVVRVQNSGGPFTLAVVADNTLRGSGSTAVNGRLVSGMNGENVTFAPHAETCAVGTFAPKTGASSSSSIAAITPATPPPATSSTSGASTAYTPPPGSPSSANTPAPSSPAAANTSAPSSGPRAAMRVLIAAEFPSGTNPMAGQPIFIMRERMDEVLRKLGVPVPPNSTPGTAMQTVVTSCRTTDCRPILTALGPYYVTGAKLDSAGKTTLSATAATGQYFLYAIVRTPDGVSLMWDIPTTLHAGDNTITLTPANAETIH
jgi:hypothetical protein